MLMRIVRICLKEWVNLGFSLLLSISRNMHFELIVKGCIYSDKNAP